MAETVTASKIDVQVKGTESIAALNEELDKSKDLLKKIGEEHGKNSDYYKNAEEDVRWLEEAIADTNKELENLGDKNLKKVNTQAKKLKGGFDWAGKAVGLMESLGVNTSGFGDVLDKASGALGNFTEKSAAFQQLKRMITAATTAIKGGFVRALTAARVASTLLMSALGIGLLIAGLAVVVQYWDDIVKLLGFGATDAEKLAKSTEKHAAATQKALDDHNSITNQLKLQGKTEKEILDMAIEKGKANLKAAVIAAQAAAASRREEFAKTQRLKKNFAKVLKFLTIGIKGLLLPFEAISRFLGKGSLFKKMDDVVSNLVFDPDKIDKEGEKAAAASDKNIRKLREQLAGYLNKKNAMTKASNDKIAADNKAAADKEKAAQKKIDDAKLAAQEEAKQKAFDIAAKAARTKKERETDEFELKLQDAEAKFLKEKELLEAQGLETITLQQNFDAEITQIAVDKYAKLQKIEDDAAAKRAAKKKEQDDADLKQTQDLADAKIEIEQNAFKAANAFNGLLGEIGKDNLETQKHQAVIQVGIDTASAISSVVASSAKLAGNPVALGLNIAAGIAVVLTNIKKATKILNAQVPSQGGGGNGFTGGLNSQTDLQNNFTPEPQDNRVYVVETDITTAQQRINDLNKIGIID